MSGSFCTLFPTILAIAEPLVKLKEKNNSFKLKGKKILLPEYLGVHSTNTSLTLYLRHKKIYVQIGSLGLFLNPLPNKPWFFYVSAVQLF